MVNIYILCRTTFFALVFFVIDGVYYFPCRVMSRRIFLIILALLYKGFLHTINIAVFSFF